MEMHNLKLDSLVPFPFLPRDQALFIRTHQIDGRVLHKPVSQRWLDSCQPYPAAFSIISAMTLIPSADEEILSLFGFQELFQISVFFDPVLSNLRESSVSIRFTLQ